MNESSRIEDRECMERAWKLYEYMTEKAAQGDMAARTFLAEAGIQEAVNAQVIPKDSQPGMEIILGHFGGEQEEDDSIIWQILAIEDGKALLLCKNALHVLPYHSMNEKCSWKECSLRHWLNHDFYLTAFSPAEQACIVQMTLNNDYRVANKVITGEETQDKVFLLSNSEVEKYIPERTERSCEPTSYAISKGAYFNLFVKSCQWWTRTIALTEDSAIQVEGDGLMFPFGNRVDAASVCVRPAMWVTL